MFVRSTTREDLFGSASNMMQGKRRKAYDDRNAWHNQFRENVTNIKQSGGLFESRYTARGMERRTPLYES
jgi:hypothetical protein